ncbi:MAG: ABC transporter ATP-binding protein [Lachnospiraceae bacterium]|nr:ABC transporter ATP-binding protein [Lachnospiraceae bacterium]
MFRLFKHLRGKDWLFMLIILCITVFSVYLMLTMPDYMNKITSLVQTGGSTSEILSNGGIMLLIAIGELVCTVIIGFLTARVASSFSFKLRSEIYNKVTSFSMEEIGRFSTASLVTRTTNDVTQVMMVIAMGLQAMLRAPIILIWAFVKIANKGSQWSVVTICAAAFVIILVGSNILLVTPKFKKIQKLTDDLNRVVRENLTGVRVVRAYNAEEYQEKQFDVPNTAITRNHLFTGRVMAYLMPGMQFVMSGMSLAVYWLGAYIINSAGVQDRIGLFSNLVVFMAYSVQVVFSFMMLAMIFIMVPRAQVSAERINAVLDMKTKIHDGDMENVPDLKGKVEFKNVYFKYPDAEEYVLENISFTAEPGETVAFIGSTGSGKSTLINLVPRFYDATEGQVLVDGVDVKEYKQRNLHDKIGYVSQKAILFKGTIASNVDYGANERGKATEDEILRAMNIAQGRDIIEKEEKGIQAEVAQGGSNFSGGQKQRISIARAICSDPEIFIFDDSFSALDYKTDKVLRAELKKNTTNATTLVVAQRIGTVKDADKIVVLDEGKMVGIGTHEELLKNCEVYQQIALSQLSGEELANA